MADIIGILSIIFAIIIPPIGLILGIIGILMNKKKKESIVLPIIGIVLSLALIALLLVVIGNIAYSGVLAPSMLLPSACIIESGFSCVQYAQTGVEEVTMTLVNVQGERIRITDIISDACSGFEISERSVNNGGMTTVKLTGCFLPSSERLNIIQGSIIYTPSDTDTPLEIELKSNYEIRILNS